MRIGTVPYYNCLPLVDSLTSQRLALPPSQLERALANGDVDVALLPVYSILKNGWHAYPEAGVIGCDGAVGSVGFFVKLGNYLEDVGTMYYDDESRSSVALGKILLNKVFKRNLRSIAPVSLERCHEAEAQLLIGDKALFFQEAGYRYQDLGELWKRLTGRGFVFACWASSEKLTEKQIATLATARSQGLKHLDKLAQDLPPRRREKILTYLTRNVMYELTPSLKDGWDLFARYAEDLGLAGAPDSENETLPLFPEDGFAAAG